MNTPPTAVIELRGIVTRFGRQVVHDGIDLLVDATVTEEDQWPAVRGQRRCPGMGRDGEGYVGDQQVVAGPDRSGSLTLTVPAAAGRADIFPHSDGGRTRRVDGGTGGWRDVRAAGPSRVLAATDDGHLTHLGR